MEGVDLDQKEIFRDKDEGIEGITPVQRLRIRTLKDSEKDVIYGIPETRPYPSEKINGFQQEVKKFVTNVQKELFIKEEPDGQKKLDFTTNTNNLTTLPRGTAKMPVLDLGYSAITLKQGASLAITPQTLNYLGGNTTYETSGYTATISDVRTLSTFNGVGVNTPDAVALNSTTTIAHVID